MNISEVLPLIQMISKLNGKKAPSKEELTKMFENLSPEEKQRLEAIATSEEVQKSIKTGDIKQIINTIKKAYSK